MKTVFTSILMTVCTTTLLGAELSERSVAFTNEFSLVADHSAEDRVSFPPSFLNRTNAIDLGVWTISPAEQSPTSAIPGLDSSLVYTFSIVGTNDSQRAMGSVSVEESQESARINALNRITMGTMDIDDVFELSQVATNQTGFVVSIFPIGSLPTNATSRPESVTLVRANGWLELLTDTEADIVEMAAAISNSLFVDE